MILHKIRMILLAFVQVLRKAFCCFSRRRRPSYANAEEHLQCISVVAQPQQNTHRKHSERDWNSWDDSPRTVEEHIEQYRERLKKPPTPEKETTEPDFFNELTPVIQPQAKYYLEDKENQTKTDFSRLAPITDVPITVDADLQDWEEDVPDAWEELDTEHTKQVIREKRKELRQKQQQKHIRTQNNVVNQSNASRELPNSLTSSFV